MKKSRLLAGVIFGALTGASVLVWAADPHPSPLYSEYCAKCHGDDGTGNTPKGKKLMARDFTDPEWQASKSDADLVKTVAGGGEDMPAFGKKLTRAQIESLIKIDVRGFGRKSR